MSMCRHAVSSFVPFVFEVLGASAAEQVAGDESQGPAASPTGPAVRRLAGFDAAQTGPDPYTR